MPPETLQPIFETIATIGAVALGGILAVLATHRLNIDRERISGIEYRKRAFLAFLAGWRYEIGRTRLVTGGFEGREETFGDKISTFAENASVIKWDFPKGKRLEFEALCSAITSIEHPTVYSPYNREQAQKTIDAIVSFVVESSE
jgi:hypothetical protein